MYQCICNYMHIYEETCVVTRTRNAFPEALKVPGNYARLSSEARRPRGTCIRMIKVKLLQWSHMI